MLRSVDPDDPLIGDFDQQIREELDKESREQWEEEVKDCDPKSSTAKFWGLIRHRSGKRVHVPPNQPIAFKGKFFSKKPAIAKRFNKKYRAVHKKCPGERHIVKPRGFFYLKEQIF